MYSWLRLDFKGESIVKQVLLIHKRTMTSREDQSCFKLREDGQTSIISELREFTLSGNFIRIAAAFILALALERLITQFVASWISPIVSIMGGRSFKNLTFTIHGSEFAYGLFIDAIISFCKINQTMHSVRILGLTISL